MIYTYVHTPPLKNTMCPITLFEALKQFWPDTLNDHTPIYIDLIQNHQTWVIEVRVDHIPSTALMMTAVSFELRISFHYTDM